MFGLFFFLFFISLIGLIVGLIKPNILKMEGRKKVFKVLGASTLVFFIISVIVVPETTEETIAEIDEPEIEEPVEEVEEEVQEPEEEVQPLELEGELSVKNTDGQITLTVNTNAPDGSIFELSVLNTEFDVESDFVEVKNGIAEVTFDISSWNYGYISAMASFPFNFEDNPQPDHIKEIYGETGEKMEGTLAVENHLNGKNGNFESVTLAYPDEETLAAKSKELFNEAIEEMKTLSEGVIVDIKPALGDWKIVDVIVSDAWYYSQDYEKERFAEQIGGLVEKMVLNTGQAEGSIQVYFKDSYGKDVAKPKLFGGYDIKN
ncbi:hypothetical protein ACJ2A9_21185 [Anaerobacillus sp. MEB173]|uniref:hypothetical protein n=1 Tax=Anaerobacillus sp. MEB173 TaxID=3383345 RepID=UPI003F912D70